MQNNHALLERIQELAENGQLSSEDAAGLFGLAGAPAQATGPAAADTSAIAIIGVGLRLPGAADLDELAELLREGRSVIEPIPAERVRLALSAAPSLAAHLPPEPGSPQGAGTSQEIRWHQDPRAYGSWLRDIEQFDPRPFGLDDYEALFLGPAERLFLQAADQALVSSGLGRDQLRGSATGVFAAYTPHPEFEYLQMFPDMDERAFISGIPATLPYHLAYRLDLRGPVLTVNTTCSSSLAALHLAKNALRAGECDLAVVAGVGVRIFPFNDDAPDHIVRSKHLRCAPFSAGADGIIGGEGIGVVIVKRLADALRDRDFIHAVVAGSAMNSDGASNGIQAPNPDAQASVITAALTDAGTSAGSIGYLEAHGTGTRLGDLVELDGLNRAFAGNGAGDGVAAQSCRLGSAKANFGHLGDCAGMAGLLAALTCLRTGTIHGIAGLGAPNDIIRWDESPFTVAGTNASWPRPADGSPRRAGISSFGISGTNVHVILQEPPDRPASQDGGGVTPVLLSARSRRALLGYVQALHRRMAAGPPVPLADVTATLAGRRDLGPSRVAFLVRDYDELVTALEHTSRMRNFERTPDGFAGQGIYLADEPDARAAAVSAVSRYAGDPLAVGDATMVRDFLAGRDVGAVLRHRFLAGHGLDLPVEPPVTRAIWPQARALEADVDDLFYDAVWHAAPRSGALAAEPTGTWLLAGDAADETVSAMARRLAGRGDRVVRVSPGNAFAELGELRYEVDLTCQESWAALLAAVGDDLTAVVYAIGLSRLDTPAASAAAVEESLATHSYGVFGLAQAIARSRIARPLRVAVVSSAAERIGPRDSCQPDAARLTGFGVVKVLSQELPTVRHVVIDHDLAAATQSVADDLVAELDRAAAEPDEHIAYRAGVRYLKRVVRQPRRPGTAIPVRPGGTYVIAGGTGYLGPQVARFLADRGAKTVMLLSRGGLPEREQWDGLAVSTDSAVAAQYRELIALEGTGLSVLSARCDVTDAARVGQVLRDVRAEHGPIAGCFMATKQLYQRWLHELTYEQFVAAMQNRIHGVWNLAAELSAPELDFFVLFSSISSLIGTKGASECCAVNQYLDAVHAQLTERGVPTWVMNWTLILDDISEFAGESPIPPIGFAQFHGAMDRFFEDGTKLSVIVRVDPDEAHRLRPVLKLKFDDATWAEIAALAGAATGEPATRGLATGEPATRGLATRGLATGEPATGEPAFEGPGRPASGPPRDEAAARRLVREAWLDVLGPQPFAETASFFNVGGTSLGALRLVQLLRRGIPERQFEVADLYNNPTVASQVAFFAAAAADGGVPAAAPVAAVAPAQAEEDLDDLLDSVSSGAVSVDDAVVSIRDIAERNR